MRVLIVHSDVQPDAPAEDQDTLIQAAAVEAALHERGHETARAAFIPDPGRMAALLAAEDPDVVFNLVESLWGSDLHAPVAPAMFARLGVPFTGVSAASMTACGDKVLAKRLLRSAGLPTAAWSEPPHWDGIASEKWIVKSIGEDASLGLDDGCVVAGRDAVVVRAQHSAAKHGGRWFAERYIEGREFNVAVIESDGAARTLPIGEMVFERWDESRPRIVGYAAKWDASAPEYHATTRDFAWHLANPQLRNRLEHLAKDCWALFGLTGYARVDFRVDEKNRPFILEVNPNPCLEPGAGLAASAGEAGLTYAALIDGIVRAALHG